MFEILFRYTLQFVLNNAIHYWDLKLLGNYWNHVFVYFEGNQALNCGEQSSLLEQENDKEPTLIETIFTVLSYCTLSPKSLGIAFESYMEKELLWNCLYNMTGFYSFINFLISISNLKLNVVHFQTCSEYYF